MGKTEVLIERRKKLVRLSVCSRPTEDSAILTHCITRRSKTTRWILINHLSNLDLIREIYKNYCLQTLERSMLTRVRKLGL
jgi:hypothetical protein